MRLSLSRGEASLLCPRSLTAPAQRGARRYLGVLRGRGADEPTLLLMTREYEGIDLNLGFINLTTASDKLADNELGWSVGMPLGGA